MTIQENTNEKKPKVVLEQWEIDQLKDIDYRMRYGHQNSVHSLTSDIQVLLNFAKKLLQRK